MRKLLVFTFLFMFAFQSLGFAAIGGAKKAPSMPQTNSIQQKAPANSQTSGYKPSTSAQSYSEKAPAAKSQQSMPQQQNSSSFLRNLGMFGGGMLLGSMLSHAFGFGATGFFSEIIGMIFNVIAIGLIFMAGRYLWNRFRDSKRNKDRWERKY